MSVRVKDLNTGEALYFEDAGDAFHHAVYEAPWAASLVVQTEVNGEWFSSDPYGAPRYKKEQPDRSGTVDTNQGAG